MRRKLAYILLSAAIIFGAGVTMATTITNLDSDVTYGSGQDMYFKISDLASTESPYNGVKPESYITDDNYVAVNAVGDEIESRLKTWGVNAEVTKEGYDTVKVSIRSQQADETEYQYLQSYLAFSGGHLTITAGSSTASVQTEADQTYLGNEYIDNAMFKGQTATIKYVNSVPVVTIPVNSTGENGALGKLIDFCKNNTVEANSSEGTSAQNCYIVLWNNRQESDSYLQAYSSSSTDYDANVAKRLIFGENASNAWYDDSDNDNDYTQFQLIPNSEALSENGYDSSKSGAAYKAAFYYMNLLNASDYSTILGDNGTQLSVSYSYSVDSTASVEDMLSKGDWHITPAMSYSLIACIVALILAAIVLIYFYRLGSLAVLSNVAVALVGTLLLVGYFSAQFGIGTLLGLAIVGISTAFGGIYYFAKLKEGVYAGKSLKKAHIDATKKTLWPNIDMGIVNIVVGLCVYGLIPGVVGKMGLVMVFGGFLGSLSNILLLRLEGWLLANDNSVEAHIGRVYGIDEKKVPNLLKEEKQTYFGSFAKVNFQKHVKPIAITSGVVLLAAIIGVSVFSGINGVAFNYSSTYDDSTSLSLEYRADKNSNATLLLGDESQLIQNFLPYVSIDGNKLSEVYVSGSIDYSSSSIYDSLDEKTYAVYYFNVPLSVVYDDKTSYEFVYSFPGKNETGTYTLNDGLSQAATLFSGDNLTISGQKVVTQAGTPTLGNVYLSVGISLIALLVYFVLRYKNSRGLALSLLSCASGVIVAGFFALTRIPVSSLSMMGIIAATVFTYILGIFVLSKEKESAKESREKDKASLAFRSENLIKSTSESAGDLLNFSFLSAGVLIIFYGLIPLTWSNIYLSCFIGFIVSLLFVLVFLAPLSNLFEKLLSQIHINFHPFKKEGVKGEIGKKKSAEPEEATFIGIND